MYSVEESREYFKQQYGALYTDAIKQLEHLLTKNITGNKHFVAFGLEAGVGKSIEAERIIAEHVSKYGEFGSRRFLLVKRFVEDVKTSTKRINEQSTAGNIAIGITRENWQEIGQELSQIEMFPVVIITHSRYFRLSQEPGIRAYFERNRHTLIIDEQLELPVYSFSDQIYREINGSLPQNLVPKLHSICQALFNEIKCLESKDKDSNLVQKANPTVDMDEVQEFEKDFRANWFHVKGDKARSKVDNLIKFLYSLETGICLYNGKRLATYNKDALRWKLSNNIILDANAGIDRRYKHAKDIAVVSPPKIIDHSDTTFHWIKNNSSKSRINKYQKEYYEKVCELVKAKHGQDDKTLIVTHNQHERFLIDCLREHGFYRIGVGSAYKGEDIAVAHFGAIIGQNYWRDFNKVWVIASPNLPMEVYPLHCSFFSALPIRNHSRKMYPVKSKGRYRFKNEKFDDVRHGSLVSEIYQAIKRINREGRVSSEIYVVHSDEDVVNEVRNQLRNVKIGPTTRLDIDLPEKIDKKVNGKVGKNEQLVQLFQKLASSSPRQYKIKEIYALLGWKNDGNLSHYMRDKEVQEMINAGLVEYDKRNKRIIFRPEAAA